MSVGYERYDTKVDLQVFNTTSAFWGSNVLASELCFNNLSNIYFTKEKWIKYHDYFLRNLKKKKKIPNKFKFIYIRFAK